MDMITVLVVLGALLVAAFFTVILVVNNKYPIVPIDVEFKGTEQCINFRLYGETIVKNNIMRLLLNQLDICGDISDMDSKLKPTKLLFLTVGMKRTYKAILRYGYLFPKIDDNINVPEELKSKPEFQLNLPIKSKIENMINNNLKSNPSFVINNKTFKINETGILVPYKIKYSNETLTEKEVHNGKGICSRFVENARANKQFNEATNPLFAVLIYSIPLFLVVIATGVIMYLSATSNADIYKSTIETTNIAIDKLQNITMILNNTKTITITR